MKQALIFDVFGTCVDWRTGVANEVRRMLGKHTDPLLFADYWRGRYDPAMERVRSGGRGYIRLDILHRENLEESLDHFGLADRLNEEEKSELNHAWEKLPSWPDVSPGLQKMREQYLLGPCSNGSIALMSRLARFAGLPWDAIVGAEIAQDYKPKPEVYLASCESFNLKPSEVIMVAAHNSDLFAARDAGLKTAFLPRPTEHGAGQTIDLAAESDWDFVATDFLDLAEKLGGTSA